VWIAFLLWTLALTINQNMDVIMLVYIRAWAGELKNDGSSSTARLQERLSVGSDFEEQSLTPG
jgi:hypothetical protein